MASTDTRTALLDCAESLVQTRGFNAFSFKDLGKAVDIRTASVHYHFETKADLGVALMERYLDQSAEQLDQLAAKRTARSRLRALIEGYRGKGQSGLMCLCGSLATDFETLPEPMRPLIARYFAQLQAWIVDQIVAGERAEEFVPAANPNDLAALLVSALQGGLILSRACVDETLLRRVERAFWKLLGK